MSSRETLSLGTGKSGSLYYGYVIVIASLMIMMLTFGLNYTFGVFLGPLTDEFGWSRAATSLTYSFVTLASGLWGIFAGRLSDRLGPKKLGFIGGFCLGLGFILMSMVNALWQTYLIYGLMLSAGIGGCWPILMTTTARWFESRRGLMTGITATGVGLGTLVTPPLTTRLIAAYGWRWAYITVGLGTMAVIMAASLFLKRDPSQIGQLPLGKTPDGSGAKQQGSKGQGRELSARRILCTRQFWMVGGIYFCFGYALHTIMVHIVPYATRMGIPPSTAAGVLATIGGTSIVAKLVVGTTSDRLGIKLTLAASLIIGVAALIWIQLTGRLWGLYLFSGAFGFAYGGAMTMQSLLLADLFGLGSLGFILGGVAFLYTIGSSTGPLIAGYIFDLTGGYHPAFAICAVVVVLAIALTVLMKPMALESQGPPDPGYEEDAP